MTQKDIKIKKINNFFLNSGYSIIIRDIPINLVIASFSTKLYSDEMAISILGKSIFKKINSAVLKRKAEFLAGRILAQRVLEKFGYKNIYLDISKERLPIWPEGIRGSISHTNDMVVCLATSSTQIKNIGVDIELLSQNASNDLIKTVINQNEEYFFMHCGLNKNIVFSLFFSAKESFFKALYPDVGYYFDFDAATILNIDTNKNSFDLILNYSLNSNHRKGSIYTGHYLIIEGHVITLLYLS